MRDLDVSDKAQVDRHLADTFTPLLEGALERLFAAYLALPTRDGQDLLASRGDGLTVRLHTGYHTWTIQRPRLADKTGTGLVQLAFELVWLVPGMGKARSYDLYSHLNNTLQLGLNLDGLVQEGQSKVVAHALMPAPAHYLPVPTVEQLQALARQGSKDPLARLFQEAVAVYRYETARGEFCYYKLRLEDPANAGKRFRRVAYTAHEGLRAEGTRLVFDLGKRLPLYGLAGVFARPNADVLVVEGEKTQQAASRRFPDHVVVSWDMPANPENTDWSPLLERNVFIFPDNDKPGFLNAAKVLGALRAEHQVQAAMGRRVSPAVRVVVPTPHLYLPAGHDLADPDPADLQGWAERALAEANQADVDIARLNDLYLLVESPIEGEAYVVVRRPFDPRNLGRAVTRLTTRELLSHHLSDLRTIQVGRTTAEVSVAKLWLESPHHATVKAVIMDPNPAYVPDPQVYNYWQGFATQPEPGPFPTIQRLLAGLAEDPAVRHHAICFMAHLFQRPHRLPLCALVIRGRQGVGKSIIAQLLELMVGHHHAVRSTNPEVDVLGDFNDLVEGKVLVAFEEFAAATGREATSQLNRLKNLITSDRLMINPKNQAKRVVDNFSHVIITSNAEVVVPGGVDARRFIYLTLTQTLSDTELKAFADATVNARNAQHPELQGFLHHLLHEVDLSTWNHRTMPQTADHALTQAAAVNQEPELAWFVQVVQDGQVLGVPVFDRLVPLELLYHSYRRVCEETRRRCEGRYRFNEAVRIFLYGRSGRDTAKAKERRLRAGAKELDLPEGLLGLLGLAPKTLTSCITVPPRAVLLERLKHDKGLALDVGPEETSQQGELTGEEPPF